jgi:hypothetical protein
MDAEQISTISSLGLAMVLQQLLMSQRPAEFVSHLLAISVVSSVEQE